MDKKSSLFERVGYGVARGAVTAAMVASLIPAPALAEAVSTTGSTSGSTATYDLSKIKDGTYNGTATVSATDSANVDEDEFDDYDVSVDVTVADHKITKVDVTSNDPEDSTSKRRNDWAKDGHGGVDGVRSQIVAKNGTGDIDTISRATISTNAIKAAVDNALANADIEEPTPDPTPDPTPTPDPEPTTTVTSWKDLYAGLNVTDTSKGYDVVTSATNFTRKHVADIADTVHKATTDTGVITGLDGVTVTGAEATLTPEVKSTEYKYTAKRGDGEFKLSFGSSVAGTTWENYFNSIYAVTVSDGSTTAGALPWLDWYGEKNDEDGTLEVVLNNGKSNDERQNVEGGPTIDRFSAFYDEAGNVKAGTYTLTVYANGYTPATATFKVNGAYTGTVTASTVDAADTALALYGLPADAEGMKATVTYKGDDDNKVKLADDASVTVNSTATNRRTGTKSATGTVALDTTKLASVPDGATLEVEIESDNYATIEVKTTKAGDVVSWKSVYDGLNAGIDTSKGYDVVTSATNLTSGHAKDIATIVHKGGTTLDGITRPDLSGVSRTDKQNTVAPKLQAEDGATYEYSCSFGDGEFIIRPDDTVEGYTWNDFFNNTYAVTVSDGTTTVGALPWVDWYGENSTSGYHYNKFEIAMNNGTSVGSNQAEVSRFAAFYDEGSSQIRPGTYTVTIYSEGYEPLVAEVPVLQVYAGTVSASAVTKSEATTTLSSLPADIADAKVNVTYTVGSGRDATNVSVATDAAIDADGKVQLSKDDLASVDEGTALNITITSSNYAPIAATTKVTGEYTYGYAGLSWAEYYAAEDVENNTNVASNPVLDSRNEADKGGYDVVTRATTNHGLGRGSYQTITTVVTTSGNRYNVNYWNEDGTFVDTDGKTHTFANKLVDGTEAFDHSEFSGLKYVPVVVKTSDLEALRKDHLFVENGETLSGGQSEGVIKSYSGLIADVDENTNGLKTVTVTDGAVSFSTAKRDGTTSGIKDQALKTADLNSMGPKLHDTSDLGKFGESIRLDFTENYGDLAANIQSVEWTYYGDDSSRSTAVGNYGTKFAADNWMHRKNGIELGLTDSYRADLLRKGYDGTGYWRVTIHALGYADATYDFQTTSDNVIGNTVEVGDYVLVNIPYADFYAAETDSNNGKVDVFTSATKDKPARDLAGGTYHKADNSEITGVTYPVRVANQDAADALTKQAKVASADALKTADSYSYAFLDGEPTSYKEVTADESGTLSFGAVSDKDSAKVIEVNDAELVTDTNWGDYEVDFDKDVYSQFEGKTIDGAVLQMSDGTGYGLRAIGNIWNASRGQVLEFAWSTMKDQVHNCPTNKEYYQSTMGKTVTGITVYTSDGTYQIKTNDLYVPLKAADQNVSAEDTKLADIGNTTVKVTTNLSAFTDPTYTFGRSSVTVTKTSDTEGTITVPAGTLPGSYTFAAKDAAGKYADVSDSFVLSTDAVVAAYDHNDVKLVKADGASDADLANYLKNVSSVTVNGTRYNTGRHGTTIVKSDGTIDTAVKSGRDDNAKPVFDGNGSYEITVVSTGYNTPLNFTLNITDKSALEEAINAAEGLNESDYTPSSWTSYQDALKAAQGVDAANATQDEVDAATKALTDAQAALVNRADKTALNEQIDRAGKLVESDYTADSWTAYQGKKDGLLSNAQTVLGNDDATQDEVDKAASDLKAAIDALVKRADKTALTKALDDASKVDTSAYTKATGDAFSAAKASAQTVSDKDDATQDEVDAATKTLTDAQAALATKASQQSLVDLNAQVKVADTLTESDYTADSWKAYQEALANAKKVAANDDASDDEVKSATDALKKAQDALVKKDASGSGSNTGSGNNTGSGSKSEDTRKTDGSSTSSTPKTGDPASIAGGVAGVGAGLAAIGAFLRRRFRKED